MRACRPLIAALLAIGLAAAAASPATATWSIIGVDPATGEVGVAVASCVPDPVTPVAVLVPGKGAAANQADENLAAGPELVRALTDGHSPEAALGPIIADDPYSSLRQYGYVSLTGGAGGHTGGDIPAEALDGRSSDGRAAVQGNTLASPAVVTGALAAYESSSGSLADRLMAALMAGSAAGGDVRCGEQRASAAALTMARPGDPTWMVTDDSQDMAMLPGPTLLLSEVSDSANAVEVLASSYRQWSQAQADGGPAAGRESLMMRPTPGTASALDVSGGQAVVAEATSTVAAPPASHTVQLALLAGVAATAAAAAAWAVRRRRAGAMAPGRPPCHRG